MIFIRDMIFNFNRKFLKFFRLRRQSAPQVLISMLKFSNNDHFRTRLRRASIFILLLRENQKEINKHFWCQNQQIPLQIVGRNLLNFIEEYNSNYIYGRIVEKKFARKENLFLMRIKKIRWKQNFGTWIVSKKIFLKH